MHFSNIFCLFQSGTVTRGNPKAERAEVILGLLLAYGGDFRSPCEHLESSWSHFECLKVRFRETFIFPIDFNDFINYGVNSELLLHHFGVSLGSLLAYEGYFEPLWGHFGSTLGSLVHPDGPINRKYTFFPLFCTATREESSDPPSRGHFGVTSGLWR